MAALDAWEADHPELLDDAEVSDTHFFGFQGNGKLSGIFDFVLVAADLRASEESLDNKHAVVGRLLSLTIDRTTVDNELEKLAREVRQRQTDITEQHLGKQLAEVASHISREMQQFAAGRWIQLAPESAAVRVPSMQVGVKVVDDAVVTAVDRQGHGLQRTLLVSALKLLASRGAKDPSGSIVCLAIEEPELFQHPTQARLLSSVLRQLADDEDSRVQIAYATHSPYFIEPRFFDQLRLVRRNRHDNGFAKVYVSHASMGGVASRLAGHRALKALRSRWHQVCLKNLSESFFAEAVVLVEGDHDKAVIEGAAQRQRGLEHEGIVIAVSNGKNGMPIPHAILTELGIPTLSIFDNDAGVGERMRIAGKDEAEIDQAERGVRRENRELLAYYAAPAEDYPSGQVTETLLVTPDNIESALSNSWPSWHATRAKIIDADRGAKGKNAATYLLTSEECADEPGGFIALCVEAARRLRL
jgi:putative ATP-dependent endonuclease of OLD family